MTICSLVLKTRAGAEQTLVKLEEAGISEDQISVVMTDKARGAHFGLKESSKTEEGVAIGGAAGGTLGAVLGAALGAGTIAIPGINLVVVGALVPALAGLGAGGAAGGLVGGLVGSGIPEHEAKAYERGIVAGNILIAVKTRTDEQKQRVDEIFDHMRNIKAAA